ncbi:MAG: diguanylate cyclase [Phycisphaerae bacterium]|nr:diguanylate cyclase [Phycisphaerae bacterium]
MAEPVDLCIIAEPSTLCDALVDRLGREGYEIRVAKTGPDGIELARSDPPRVILCDWNVGDLDGTEICCLLQADPITADSYVILLAEEYTSQACARVLAAGGDDLVGRDRPFDELLSRVRVGIRMWNLQAGLKRTAITDGLTGLYNHRHFLNVIDSEFARSRRYGSRLSLILLDLDLFKAVNDIYGHQIGDMVLRQVGQALNDSVRDSDTVARYGGEEFAIVAPEATLAQAEELADRLRQRIADIECPEEMHGNRITASFGVASDEDSHVDTASALVGLTDQALYAAKRTGRNRIVSCAQLPGLVETGAHDPVEVEQLRRQVASLSVQAKEAYVQSIWALVQALEARDKYTARHSQNVTFFAEQIARRMGLSPALTRSVRLAAMLHDIGKIGVPDSVLMKPGPLTEEERSILRSVPQLSANIVDHMRILQAELPMIRHQHENFDGSGYPMGLAGNQIPIGARILMVAETFDALTADRVFRPSRSVGEALKEIRTHSGTQFDPKVVEALASCLEEQEAGILEYIDSSREALKSGMPPVLAAMMKD